MAVTLGSVAGCDWGAGEPMVVIPASPVLLTGGVEKGPFILGSSVEVSPVDARGTPTGEVSQTQTTDDLGTFGLTIRYEGGVALEATGYYYDEVLGQLSAAPLMMRAFFVLDTESTQTAHINLVTHLSYERVRTLLSRGAMLHVAIAQAEAELVAAMPIAASPEGTAGADMSMLGGDSPGNAYLFALSAMVTQAALDRGGPTDAALAELSSTLAHDLADDGVIAPPLREALQQALAKLDPDVIMNRLAARLAAMGVQVTIPDLTAIIAPPSECSSTCEPGTPPACPDGDTHARCEHVGDCWRQVLSYECSDWASICEPQGGCRTIVSPDTAADDGVVFRYKDRGALTVEVTGDFVTPAWETYLPLTKRDGVFESAPLLLAPAIYRYKFRVNGSQLLSFDPVNPSRVDDGHGGFNSIVTVGEPVLGDAPCSPESAERCDVDISRLQQCRQQADGSWRWQLLACPSMPVQQRCITPVGTCHELPVVTDTEATFYYRSTGAPTVTVKGSFTSTPWEEEIAMAPVAGTDFFAVTVSGLTPGATYEYQLVVNGIALADELNPRRSPSGASSFATACVDACTPIGATACTDGALATCSLDANGCAEWSAAVACTSGACASNEACASTGDGAGGVVSCSSVIRYDPRGSSAGPFYLRGEFNAWSLETPMAPEADGTYTATLTLPAGDYGYKFFDEGTNRWFEDPTNSYFKYVGGVRNSRLRVMDCKVPAIVLAGPVSADAGSVSFTASYLEGAERAGIDVASIRVTRNGELLTGTYDAAAHAFTIHDNGLTPGKYVYRLQARDLAGRTARSLYVPVWVEATAWSWKDAIVYGLIVDRFANGTTTNDAPLPDVSAPANWQGGDFAGIKKKIEEHYFENLGVNALDLSPVSEQTHGAMTDIDGRSYAAYHGFWPISSGWYEGHPVASSPTDPHFGSLDELRALVRAAHAQGIRVIVDLVINHVHQDTPLCGDIATTTLKCDAHPAFFHNPEGPHLCPPDWDNPIICWITPALADLNFTNLEALETMLEHAAWLAQEAEIDGFNLDAIKHVEPEVLYGLQARLRERVDPSFLLIGTQTTGEAAGADVKRYVDDRMLDGQLDYPLYWNVLLSLLRRERSLSALKRFQDSNEGFYGPSAVMISFIGNRDVPRALSHAALQVTDAFGNKAREQGWTSPPPQPSAAAAAAYASLRTAWTFLMTSPGAPFIYYGDEIGLAGAGDPDNRRSMPEAGMNDEQLKVKAHLETLTTLRRRHPALRRGTRSDLYLAPDGRVWAYARSDGADRAIVVLNSGAATGPFALPVAGLGIADGTPLRDEVSGGSVIVSDGVASVTVAAGESAVLVP